MKISFYFLIISVFLVLYVFAIYFTEVTYMKDVILQKSIMILKRSKYVTVNKEMKKITFSFNLCNNRSSDKFGSKVLAYSIFGPWAKDPIRIAEIELAIIEARNSSVYHDWMVRVYHDQNLGSLDQEKLLSKHKNLYFCDTGRIPYYGNLSHTNGREWRFIPIGDRTVDIMCSRDTDSPLWQREFEVVDAWLKTNTFFHVIRDHSWHDIVVLSGLFCVRNSKNRTLADTVFQTVLKHLSPRVTAKQSDQYLLRDRIWTLVKNDALQHDSYHCNDFKNSIPFPNRRKSRTNGYPGCRRGECHEEIKPCPVACRPTHGKNWTYC